MFSSERLKTRATKPRKFQALRFHDFQVWLKYTLKPLGKQGFVRYGYCAGSSHFILLNVCPIFLQPTFCWYFCVLRVTPFHKLSISFIRANDGWKKIRKTWSVFGCWSMPGWSAMPRASIIIRSFVFHEMMSILSSRSRVVLLDSIPPLSTQQGPSQQQKFLIYPSELTAAVPAVRPRIGCSRFKVGHVAARGGKSVRRCTQSGYCTCVHKERIWTLVRRLGRPCGSGDVNSLSASWFGNRWLVPGAGLCSLAGADWNKLSWVVDFQVSSGG